ncbi:hypothetical protein GALL_342810 [mine drainage metagenome]|uniref:Uncharacterized protein n=1 Tax=mine drainage metagenome TaxID=410659 RepID=A0A1J5R2D7_9ZZZZ
MFSRLAVLACLISALIGNPASAAHWSAGAGYAFISGSNYVALDYRKGNLAGDLYLLHMGREEPTTKSGPELSMNLLAYLPNYPFFAKAGVVAGWGKRGADAGLGIDMPLSKRLGASKNLAVERRAGHDVGRVT